MRNRFKENTADVYILNTCAVTGDAESKSRKYLRKIIKNNPAALVFVSGCCGVFSPEIGEIEGVTGIIPIAGQEKIVEIISQKLPVKSGEFQNDPPDSHDSSNEPTKKIRVRSIDRTRGTLKVQDGCDHGCTYCAVTLSRGAMRSMPVKKVLTEIGEMLESGTREIVLTGIRLDAYGADLGSSLAELITATVPLDIPRLRIGSVEPLGVTDEFISACKDHPTLCRHFHLCLQSGDDNILKMMNRGYTAYDYLTKISALKAAMPDATFTTDVIVGFPGEDETAFQNTMNVAEEVGYIKMHVFKFSPRKGTIAATLPNAVSPEIKEERSKKLLELDRELYLKSAKALIGKEVSVLVETQNSGTTDSYFHVTGNFKKSDKGKIIKATVLDVDDFKLFVKT